MSEEVNKKHCTAIVLSAGQGKRMGTDIQKQYLELDGHPLIYYTLEAFQKSDVIDDIIMVVGDGQEDFVKKEIIAKYGFSKVKVLVCGGKERYDSVWNGLQVVRDGHLGNAAKEGYIFIHDGARPFVTDNDLKKGYDVVQKFKACVAGMPSKDTVKIVDDQDFAKETPNRKYVWIIQTPQIFEASIVIKAYSRFMEEPVVNVTDDAMVVEQMLEMPVKLYEASYENIKITTPEDLKIAGVFLKRKK